MRPLKIILHHFEFVTSAVFKGSEENVHAHVCACVHVFVFVR